jgi:hypothetical protein
MTLLAGHISYLALELRMQYAEVHIIETKTKPRILPLIFSIPYLKDWI